jgi:hypothetical protein
LSLSYEHVNQLFKSHPALRLLRAEHAPLILTFLDRVFIQLNVRFISGPDIVSRLEDTLYNLRETEGAEAYPRSAEEYINDWAQNDKGWLRKYYPENSDEPHFDLTPAAEKALNWIDSLSEKAFVGTESRLFIIFELLRQMTLGVEKDAGSRIAELEKKKSELDAEIAQIRQGKMELMNGTALRDRFMQFSSMAKELLSDFRTVEHNFRKLDSSVREKIALWDGNKGDLLEIIFGERDIITGSDQGRSFNAFFDFLMSRESQEEFTALLEKVFNMEELAGYANDRRLKQIHYDWLDAGEHTQRTIASLSSQLRRYLDNQAYLENKRIMKILDHISASALNVKDDAPEGIFMQQDDPAPGIKLPLERPMYRPSERINIDASVCDADGKDIDYSPLLEQVYVDKTVLLANIRAELYVNDQIALNDIIKKYPLTKGLTELIAYMSIASSDPIAVLNDERRVYIEWTNTSGEIKRAVMPLIIFNRRNNDRRI